MSTVNVAHLGAQGISFAVFEADAPSHTHAARSELLCKLTARARHAGLRVDKSALAYVEFGTIKFFGPPDLVRYLADGWSPEWTHTIDV